MAQIGDPTPEFPLYLPTVGDFVISFDVEGDPLDPSKRLYLAIGTPPTPATEWDFTIASDGLSVELKIESEEVQDIRSGTKYWLMYQDPDEDPTWEIELQTGTVEKVNA